MSTEALEQALQTARDVLANVQPNQMDDATPCQSWNVKALVNHMVSGAQWFGETMDSGTSDNDDSEPDVTDGDFVAKFDAGAKGAVEAFGRDGALQKTVKLPFGEFPGVAFMGLATTDSFTHAWDLAKATGQDTNLNPQLAAQILEGAKASIPDQFRGEDGKMPFGPQQEAPAGASNADQLAAFLGRKV